jgi:hypothetical protein
MEHFFLCQGFLGYGIGFGMISTCMLVCIINKAILSVNISLTLEKDKHLPNVVELHVGKPFDYV